MANAIGLVYFQRFLRHNRYSQPYYQPLDADKQPNYNPSKAYRLRLVGSTDDVAIWPEFIVMNMTSHLEQQNTVVELI